MRNMLYTWHVYLITFSHETPFFNSATFNFKNFCPITRLSQHLSTFFPFLHSFPFTSTPAHTYIPDSAPPLYRPYNPVTIDPQLLYTSHNSKPSFHSPTIIQCITTPCSSVSRQSRQRHQSSPASSPHPRRIPASLCLQHSALVPRHGVACRPDRVPRPQAGPGYRR